MPVHLLLTASPPLLRHQQLSTQRYYPLHCFGLATGDVARRVRPLRLLYRNEGDCDVLRMLARRARQPYHMNLAMVPSGQLKGRQRNGTTVATSTIVQAAAITASSPTDGGSMCKNSMRNGTVKYLQR